MPCAFHAKRPTPYNQLDPNCQFDVPDDDLIIVDDKRGVSITVR